MKQPSLPALGKVWLNAAGHPAYVARTMGALCKAMYDDSKGQPHAIRDIVVAEQDSVQRKLDAYARRRNWKEVTP